MAAKKDFTTASEKVFNEIAIATGTAEAEKTTSKTAAASKAKTGTKPRKTYTEAETLEALESLKTSGKKGVALPRKNLALTPSNFDYVNTMAAMQGISVTEFINNLIKKDSETGENAKAYKQILKVRNSINK